MPEKNSFFIFDLYIYFQEFAAELVAQLKGITIKGVYPPNLRDAGFGKQEKDTRSRGCGSNGIKAVRFICFRQSAKQLTLTPLILEHVNGVPR